MAEVRIALIGCGAIARRLHLPLLQASGAADVVAFASGRLASAEAARADWGSGDVVERWEDAVGRDDVDAVVVCTPNHLHAPVAIAAAEGGKHVLVEKPMATTLADADEMIAAAATAGVVLVPAQNVRFAAPFVAACDAVARGDVGDLVAVRAAFGHAGPDAWAPEATWFRDPERASGGALLDLGVHVADLLRAVAGDEVVEVAAMVDRPAPGAIDEAAQVLVRFAGGATGAFHVSWQARPGPDHQLTIFGTKGTLHLDGATPLTLRRSTGDAPEVLAVGDAVPEPVAGFLRAAQGDGPPPVTAADGRAALAIVVAAYEAARTGTTVAVDGGTRR